MAGPITNSLRAIGRQVLMTRSFTVATGDFKARRFVAFDTSAERRVGFPYSGSTTASSNKSRGEAAVPRLAGVIMDSVDSQTTTGRNQAQNEGNTEGYDDVTVHMVGIAICEAAGPINPGDPVTIDHLGRVYRTHGVTGALTSAPAKSVGVAVDGTRTGRVSASDAGTTGGEGTVPTATAPAPTDWVGDHVAVWIDIDRS